MTKVLALRHMYSGSMFNVQTIFEKQGFETAHVEGFATDLSRLDALEPDVLVVMGGAMGVYEADLYPYLHHEIRIIKERVAADRPTLGICLGSQLMAASQGCRVFKGPQGREHGFLPITLTDAGRASPLHHLGPDKTNVLHMHGDTFDLPDTATLLASTEMYANQAYRIGQNCFATQFHPEFDRIGFENLLVEDNSRLDVAAFRAEAEENLPAMEVQTEKFILDLIKIWGLKSNA
jgi:GMP synthase (glutamine-hydrolysing)